MLQFTKAVEAKQVAQQDAERARFVVLKAEQVRPQLLRSTPFQCNFQCWPTMGHQHVEQRFKAYA